MLLKKSRMKKKYRVTKKVGKKKDIKKIIQNEVFEEFGYKNQIIKSKFDWNLLNFKRA